MQPVTKRLSACLSHSKEMQDELLGHMAGAAHRVELDPHVISPILLLCYQTMRKPRYFEKNGISNMLLTNVIQPAHTKFFAPMLLASKKDGHLQF